MSARRFFVLIGAPGAGKGTQAERLAARLELCQLSTGELLREAVRAGTELGRAADAVMRRGALVDDAVILELVREELRTPRCAKGAVLDGFPRNVAQAEGLERLLGEMNERLERVLFIDVDDEEVVRRLSRRRVCARCGHVVQPAGDGAEPPRVCEVCRGELVQRADDRPETIRHRLEVFREQTAPLLAWYGARGLVREVAGGGDVAQVHARVLEEVG